eukprot:4829550-Pleurochrysis_carterae.AAC.1
MVIAVAYFVPGVQDSSEATIRHSRMQFRLPVWRSVSAKICAELAEPLFQPTLVGEASGPGGAHPYSALPSSRTSLQTASTLTF